MNFVSQNAEYVTLKKWFVKMGTSQELNFIFSTYNLNVLLFLPNKYLHYF